MRVIGGTHRGRRITAPPGRGTRPMLARVREAIFNQLVPWIPDGRVLDLFAGSGSLGIEALSRGAAFARFVERGEVARGVLAQNLTAFGLAERAEVLGADALMVRSAQAPLPFDVVFFDPPYPLLDEAATRSKLLVVTERTILGDAETPAALAADGVFVFHAPVGKLRREDFSDALEVAVREWGTTAIWFLGRAEG